MITQSFDPDLTKTRGLLAAGLLLVTSLFIFWAGWHYPAAEQSTFAAGLTRGEVLQVTPSQERGDNLLLGYDDGSGTQQLGHEHHDEGKHRVGDRVWISYIRSDPQMARIDPSMPWEIASMMAIGVPGFVAGFWLVARTLRRCAQRRLALTEWTRMNVQAPRIQTSFLQVGPLRRWRLQARMLDQKSAHWHDIHSDWCGSLRVPAIAANSDWTVLVDPREPRQYWLPPLIVDQG